VTAANTFTNLQGLGDGSTSQPTIPNGVTVLDRIIVNGISGAGNGSALLLVGVNGTGIIADEKPVLFPVVGNQAATTAGQMSGPRSADLRDLQIGVKSSQEFNAIGVLFGDDLTDADIGIAMGFI